MSTWYSAVVRCPACEHTFEGRFVRGANAARAPELREAALAGTLNRPPCPACGRAHAMDATLVYADPPRGHWISVARRGELAEWATIERAAVAAFQTSLETAVAEAFAGARVRVVFDLDELRERLAIWDAGLDDGVLECVKLSCLRERPELRGPGERIRVARIAAAAITMHVLDGATPELVRGGFEIPCALVEQVAGDPAWRAQFPELFGAGFVSIDRYLR